MSSKKKILEAIAGNKPAATALPELLAFSHGENLEEKFAQSVVQNGGAILEADSPGDIQAFVKENFVQGLTVVSLVEGITGNLDARLVADPHELEKVEVAIMQGEIGVAENAAVWISEKSMPHRVLPFITQHLILVLDKTRLVGDMHEAYQQLDVAAEGYGVFVAGPSKTADIEQSLVVGAHGPRSFTVFLR